MKKGSGEVLNALLLIVIMIAIGTAFVTNVFSSSIKRNEILLYETDVLFISNTMSLVQTSLMFTWHVSTIQSLFKTADDSIGCKLLNQNLYWYKTDIERSKSELDVNRLPVNNKMNDPNNNNALNPKICLPRDIDVINYLDQMFGPYKNIIKSFSNNGVKIDLDKINNIFNFYSDGVGNKVSLDIIAKFSKADSKNTSSSSIFIPTKLSSMIDAGKYLVTFALELSDATTFYVTSNGIINPKYIPLFTYKDAQDPSGPDSKETYQTTIKSMLKDSISQSQIKNKVFVSSSINTDYFVPDDKQFVVGPRWQQAGQGLILHYNINSRISDVPVPLPPKQPLYQNEINSVVSGKIWKFGKNEFKQEEITALVDSIIQFGSDWDRYYIAPTGTKGLMQIDPSTCQDSPIDPRFSLFDPTHNVDCGVNNIYDLFNRFSNDKIDKQDLLKFVIASYIDKPDDVYAEFIKSVKWDDAKLSSNTKLYVNDLLGYYGFYLSDYSISIKLDQPLTIKTISSCFGYTNGLFSDGITIVSGDQQVKAAFDGEVVESVRNCFDSTCNNGLGNSILIKHSIGDKIIYTFYGNLRDVTTGLKNVNKGQAIGNAKNDIFGNFVLFFKVKNDATPMNPCSVMSCNNLCSADAVYNENSQNTNGAVYYYETPATKNFVPRNIVLPVKLEDYIFAIDCSNDYKAFTPSLNSIAPYTPITSTQTYADWLTAVPFSTNVRYAYNGTPTTPITQPDQLQPQTLQNLNRPIVFYKWGAPGFDLACFRNLLLFCATPGVEPPAGLQEKVHNTKTLYQKDDRSETFTDFFVGTSGPRGRFQLLCGPTGFARVPSVEP